jgi:YVTN family beta-propeller protein
MRYRILLSVIICTIILPSLVFGSSSYFYTANEGGSISKIDAISNKVIKDIKLDGIVHNVQISPNGEVLAAVLIPKMASHGTEDGMTGQALFFSTRDDRLIKRVGVGKHPAHIVYTLDGKYVLVTNNEDDNISVISGNTYSTILTIPTGKGPHGFRISKDCRYAYVANMGEDTVSVIDLNTLKEDRRIKVGKNPVTTGVTSDGRTLAVTINGENAMAIVDLTTDKIERIEVGYGPAQVFIGPTDEYAYVANQGTEIKPSNTLTKVDLKAKKVAATIVTGKGAHGVVTDKNGKFIYVTNMFENTVSVIDNRTNMLVATIPVGQTPNGITYK